MMLSGPSLGTERYKEAKLFISRVLDGASISPRSMESLAIKRRAGRESEEQRGGWRTTGREWHHQNDCRLDTIVLFIIIFHLGCTQLGN